MTWGTSAWGVAPWGGITFLPASAATAEVVAAEVLSQGLIQLEFTEGMKANSILRDPTNYTVVPNSTGLAVTVKSVLGVPATAVGTTVLLLETTDFTIGATYTVTAADTLIALDGGLIDAGTRSAEFIGRLTKIDNIKDSRPELYNIDPKSIIRNVINAIGREDDLIGGSRDDRLPTGT